MADEQRTLLEYEFYRTQIEVLRKNLVLIDASLSEIELARSVLSSMKGLDEKNELLVPIGAGSFVSARLLDTKGVILDLGANVAAKKGIAEAGKELEERTKRLEDVKKKGLSDLKAAAARLEELAPAVEGILAKIEEKRGE